MMNIRPGAIVRLRGLSCSPLMLVECAAEEDQGEPEGPEDESRWTCSWFIQGENCVATYTAAALELVTPTEH